ncbi:BZ3500_MvSof-1268-A1-R1_Chr10-1g02660 [Microbotryum saponariae]|uniref:BZ3500_MvSof-1268-A1-R1_Chr10-1g02660 protein n=1 Tax=Microbotryum saponariae TaxID=289078 RepID=A0A2X0LJV2_9BASI|nr:BZ3500_MvSof-1268-A1-R1_Chr10-1g02660 [Microbotryum saponariae]SDA06149.1 BZ3501_MvSof-1269-A2-R1_Chr10-1g02261 [Microbotryum saponariae]
MISPSTSRLSASTPPPPSISPNHHHQQQQHQRRAQSVSYLQSASPYSPTRDYDPSDYTPSGYVPPVAAPVTSTTASSNANGYAHGNGNGSPYQAPVPVTPPTPSSSASNNPSPHKRRHHSLHNLGPLMVPSPPRPSLSTPPPHGLSSYIIEEENEEEVAEANKLPTAPKAHDEDDEDEFPVEEDDEESFLPLPSPNSSSMLFQVPPTTTVASSATSSRTEHARSHSRIHERNLSVFFPRPGQAAQGYGDTFSDPNASTSTSAPAPIVDISSPTSSRASDSRSPPPSKSRRGHHHKHSVSHNFFSFMEPGQISQNGTSPVSPPSMAHGRRASIANASGHAAAMPFPKQSHLRYKHADLPSPLRFFILSVFYLPSSTRGQLLLAVGQVVLGASLWITGQAAEALSVTGLGYLIVFDGLGALSRIFVDGARGIDALLGAFESGTGNSSMRTPYGSRRLVTLSHFSQAIYLLFSAVYVCKESVEHVLLLHGGAEHGGAHGAGHGGMGHGEAGAGMTAPGAHGGTTSVLEEGIKFPVVLLALSATLTLLTSIMMSNHYALAQAIGPTSSSAAMLPSRPRPLSSLRGPSVVERVMNPFTATILMFSVGLCAAGLTIPGAQLAPLDKVVALMQSIAMFYVAYPAAVTTGQVLLQTAPDPESLNSKAVQSAVRDIENHPLVVSLDRPHVWQMITHPASLNASSSTNPTPSNINPSQSDGGASLIATLVVHVKASCTDADILTVTKFCRERCRGPLRLGDQGPDAPNERFGEVTVQVVREKKGEGGYWAQGDGVKGIDVEYLNHGVEQGHGHGHGHGQGLNGGAADGGMHAHSHAVKQQQQGHGGHGGHSHAH